MTDHVAATLDGALPAAGGAMRWRPPPTLIDWRRILGTVDELLQQIAAGLRNFLDALAQVWRLWVKTMSPALRAVADVARHRRARLSRMRRDYRRRRR